MLKEYYTDDKKKGWVIFTFLVGLFIIVILLVKPVGILTGHVIIDLRDNCEIDRSCCADIGLQKICFRNDTNPSFSNPFKYHDLYLEDNSEADIWHYHGSMFNNNNVDGLPGKGGFGRVYYGSYGVLWNGPSFGSGIVDKTVWYPTKYLEWGHLHAPFSATYESEITFDRYYLASKVYAQCNGNDGCNQTQGDPITFQIAGTNGGQGAVWRSDIDSDFCGFEETFLKGSTPYEDSLDRDFLFVISPCPDGFDEANRKFFFDRNKDEIANFTLVVTDSEHETGISEWINNYYNKELEIRSEYENFTRGMKYPLGQTNDVKKSYYLTDYSNWYDTFAQFDDSETTNFRGKEIVTPNLGYYGMWKWDSFWSAFSILGSIDEDSINKDIRLDMIRDWIYVWKYHTEGKNERWPQNIRKNAIPAAQQNEGGWTLAAWDLYQKDGDLAALCDFADNLASDYEAYRATRGDDWRLDVLQLGRDGSDASANGDADGFGETVDSTAWFMLDALANANIQKECKNNAKAEEYFTDFENIKADVEAFWDSTTGFYVNLNKDNSGFLYKNGDLNSYSSTPNVCWLLAMDAIPENRVQTVVDKLFTDFVDVIGFTSIPTTHQCYTSNGAESSCWAGENWDGPTWAGTDNSICTWALRQQVNTYGRTYLQDELDSAEEMTLQIAQQTPFGAESYDSDGSGVGNWGSRPYGWGAMVGTNPITGYNPLSTLSLSMAGVFTTPSISSPSADSTIYSDSINVSYSSIGATSYTVYGDGTPVCTDTTETTCTWSGFISGPHTIRVVATDGSEQKETSVSFEYEELSITIEHPILLFNKTELETIKNNVQTGPYSNKYAALLNFADNVADWDPSSSIGSVIWSKGYYPMQLGLAYQLTGNTAYADKGRDYLLGFAQFTTQEYAGESQHAVSDTFWQLSMAYDFLYETMSPSERQTIVDFFYDTCITGGLFEDYYKSYGSHNGAGLNTAFGVCALSIYGEHATDPFFNVSTNYWGMYYNATNNYLGGYFNSSYTMDGFSYQEYGLRHALTFIEAYDRRFPENAFFDRYEDTICGMPEYYTFSIWDNDQSFEGEYIRRMDISDMQYAYYPSEPEIQAYLANKCQDPVMQWSLLWQNNNSARSAYYNSVQSAEDLIRFDASLEAVHPADAYPLSWKDSHNDLVIWRDGWTFSDDLVVTFKSDDENGGHPHADDNMILLFYGDELLTDNGYRNGTGEIPGGECYHNTLVVDDMCDMKWVDRGSYSPTGNTQLFGDGDDVYPGDCTWPDDCFYMPDDFRGQFVHLTETEDYRAVEGIKPYYSLDGFSRYVVVLEMDPPVIVMKDTITSDQLHDYDINFAVAYDNVTELDNETLFVQNNDANLKIKTVYTTEPFTHRLLYETYGKTYRGNHNYEEISSSSKRVDDAYNLTMVNVLMPYLDTETSDYQIHVSESDQLIIVDIVGADKNYSVRFDKADVQEVSVSGVDQALPDLRFPTMDTFDGATSNITNSSNLGNYTNLVLEKTIAGKVEYSEAVDVRYIDFDDTVTILPGLISIDSSSEQKLNKSALLTFYEIDYVNPIPMVNGAYCEDCSIIGYEGENFSFTVPHFTEYAVGTSAQLSIWENVTGDSVTVFADYFNLTDSEPISGNCTIDIDGAMSFNGTIYSWNKTYNTTTSKDYTVSCISAAFDLLNASNSYTVQVPCISGCNYTASLEVWHELLNDSYRVYANYTNMSEAINGSCQLSFENSTSIMSLTSLYSGDINTSEDLNYSVSCESDMFETLVSEGSVIIDTCGDSVCEVNDGNCPADCGGTTNCGTFGNTCVSGYTCDSGVCTAPSSESDSSNSGSSGGGSSSSSSSSSSSVSQSDKDEPIENNTSSLENVKDTRTEESIESVQTAPAKFFERGNGESIFDAAGRQLADTIRVVSTRAQGIVAIVTSMWVLVIILMYLSREGHLQDVPVLHHVHKIPGFKPKGRSQTKKLYIMLNLLEQNHIMTVARIQKVLKITDGEFTQMIKFLEEKGKVKVIKNKVKFLER